MPELGPSQQARRPVIIYASIVQLVFLGVLCAGVHWLIARSRIAEPLWSRARGVLAELLECAGCSGFWIGLGLGALGLRPLCIVGGLAGDPIAAVISGILGVFVTPIFEAVLLWGLERSAIHHERGNL